MFSLRFSNLRWITDPPEIDLCAHGDVEVRIGEATLESDNLTVSAGGLFLLRALTEDYSFDPDSTHFLIPCCGFTMWVHDDGSLSIPGCPHGLGWNVIHVDGKVRLETGDQRIEVSRAEFVREVLAAVDQVKAFYDNEPDRTLPDDPVDVAGYEAFWSEWSARRAAAV